MEEEEYYKNRDTPLTDEEETAIREKLNWIPESAFDNGYFYIWYKEDMSRLLNAYARLRKETSGD